jgi:hypothetical protein
VARRCRYAEYRGEKTTLTVKGSPAAVPAAKGGASGLVAAGDAVRPRPAAGSIGMAGTVLDLEAFRLSLEKSDKRRAVVRHVVGMDAIEPLCRVESSRGVNAMRS